MKTLRNIVILFTGITLCIASTNAQVYYNLDPIMSKIAITGTSNMHDWEMQINDPAGKVNFLVSNEELQEITSLKIKFITERIESGNNIMNNKTYKALDADRYNEIIFNLIDVDEFSSEGTSFRGLAKGELMLAGKSRIIQIPFNGSVINSYRLSATGEFSIKMTDFDVEPPTAMMGAMKTGNEITIIFDMFWTSGT